MGVLKYCSVRYDSGGVDIENTVEIPAAVREHETRNNENAENRIEEKTSEPRFSAEEILAQRETEIILKERELEKIRKELSTLKEQ